MSYFGGDYFGEEEGSGSTPFTGVFGSRYGMERIRGEINVAVDADKDSDGADSPEVDTDVTEALADANADIQLAWESRLCTLGVTPPTTLSGISIPTAQRRWLDRTANMGAVYYNGEGRGFEQDAGDDYAGKMATLKKEYEARLQQIRDGSILSSLEQTEDALPSDVPGVARPDGARVSAPDLPRVCNSGPGYVAWPGRN